MIDAVKCDPDTALSMVTRPDDCDTGQYELSCIATRDYDDKLAQLHQLTMNELTSGLVVYADHEALIKSKLTEERILILLYMPSGFVLVPAATGTWPQVEGETILFSNLLYGHIGQCWHHYRFTSQLLPMLYTFGKRITDIEQQALRAEIQEQKSSCSTCDTKYHLAYLAHWSCLGMRISD